MTKTRLTKGLSNMFFGKRNTYTWGVPEMDRKFGRPNQNDIILTIAGTGTGKSTYAFSMALENAKAGKKVLIYSLETIPEVTIRNFIAITCHIAPHQIDDQSYTPEQKQKLDAAIEHFSDIDNVIWRGIEDVYPEGNQTRMSVYDMINDIKKMSTLIKEEEIQKLDNTLEGLDNKSEEEQKEIGNSYVNKLGELNARKSFVDYIIIDNLGFMRTESMGSSGNENSEQGEIIMEFARFSKNEIACPLFILHHINKASSKPGEPISQTSIRGNQKLADTATIVMALNRPDPSVPDVLFGILKNRNSGRIVDILTEFRDGKFRFKPSASDFTSS